MQLVVCLLKLRLAVEGSIAMSSSALASLHRDSFLARCCLEAVCKLTVMVLEPDYGFCFVHSQVHRGLTARSCVIDYRVHLARTVEAE